MSETTETKTVTSTKAKGEIAKRAETSGRLMSIFLPTTPNPTSGFYLVVPTVDVFLVDLSVEEAFKMIMSAGIVVPADLRAVTRLSEISDLPDLSRA